MDHEDTCLVVLCTAPNTQVAEALARGLVEAGLCACVNVLPGIGSFYVWQGELCAEQEVQLLLKTRSGRFEALRAFVAEHHPYDEPELIALPIVDGSAGYLAWVRAQTR